MIGCRWAVVGAAVVGLVSLAACSDSPASPTDRPGESTDIEVGDPAVPATEVVSTTELVSTTSVAPITVPDEIVLPPVSTDVAVHVAPTGDDAAAGSSDAPVRTVERAQDLLGGAGVVQLSPGEYHESIRLQPGVALVGDPESPESVVIDGAVVTAGWRDDGGTWSIPWQRGSTAGHDAVPADRPEAGATEIVVIDGAALTQLPDGTEPGPGTFAVVDDRLVLGDSPQGRTVEVGEAGVGIDMQGADGSRVSGLTVRRWATPLDRLAAVRAYADDVVVDHVVVEDNAAMGLSVIGDRVVVSEVSILRNGYIGLHAHDSTDLTVQRAQVDDNNAEGFDPVHSGAGVKITSTDGLTLLGVEAWGNEGPGVWTDLAVHDATVAACDLVGNVGSGLLIELSGSVRVTGCRITATRGVDRSGVDVQGAGLWVLESNDVVVEASTVSDNAPEVWVQDGPRTVEPSFVTDPSVLWDLRDVRLHDLSIGPGRSGDPALVLVDDWTATRPASDMHVTIADIDWRVDAVPALLRWARWPEDPLLIDDPAVVSDVADG